MEKTRQVGILVFDDVEVLDFCGPFEVFSVTGRGEGRELFQVSTVGKTLGPVLARGGLSINPHFSLVDAPVFDILLVPGGYGTRPLVNDEEVLAWIRHRSFQTELLLSVCTGALLLAKAGLLEGLTATTHPGAVHLLEELAPNTTVDAGQRFIDNGRIILSAGISAGIDMSLYVVGRLHGVDEAVKTAAYMEYDWTPVSA